MDSERDPENSHRKGAASKSSGCDARQRWAQSEALVFNTLMGNERLSRRRVRGTSMQWREGLRSKDLSIGASTIGSIPS